MGSGAWVLLLLGVVSTLAVAAQQCDSEQQVIMCGQLPVETAAQQQAYLGCCAVYKPVILSQETQEVVVLAAAAAAEQALQVPRPDLDPSGSLRTVPNYFYSPVCNNVRLRPAVPTFSQRSVSIKRFSAPVLGRQKIQAIKAAALARLTGTRAAIRADALSMRSTSPVSGFVHPAGQLGTAELAAMKQRLADISTLQSAALAKLLTGSGVPPKLYGSWSPPTDTPLVYEGPYPAAKVVVLYGGSAISDPGTCPPNYPAAAPRAICGHVALVELDGQMSYKQALAYRATGDVRYADNTFRIISGWATVNKEITPVKENAPLEAGWAISSMAKALELLRDQPGWTAARAEFAGWVDTVMMPTMDQYINNISWNAIQKVQNIYGNWHSTIAEAYMAYALLTDNSARWAKGVALFTNTTADYLRWGKGAFAAGRVLGEATETLRDIYHTEFGLGGLLQIAEMAWQQDQDLYSTADFALAAAMELHARIINAWDANKDESLLPLGFSWFQNMPSPPAGTQWRFNITSQTWFAMDTKTFQKVSDLNNGVKYLVGVKYLPTGWDLGYNHFAGRLGLKMPETATLLSRYNPDYYEFHWGLSTLPSADTALLLWRPGVTRRTMCV